MWIDYFRELDTTNTEKEATKGKLWIDYFRELDTTIKTSFEIGQVLWTDYFRELDTTLRGYKPPPASCGLITLGN